MTTTVQLPDDPIISLVGAGTIGMAWAVVFSTGGMRVKLYDSQPGALETTLDKARARLGDLARHGLIPQDGGVEDAMALIEPVTDLGEALDGASLIQENVPEFVDLKRDLLAQVAELAPENCAIASSTSFIEPSRIFDHVKGRERCLVLHPGNPPFLIRVVEVVPAPFTSPEAVEIGAGLMARAGMAPVYVNKEVEGFVLNRLQGALLREAYCLVRDGVTSVEDIDRIVRDGLGFRWSLIGPFESVDLGTRGGIAGHAERMGPSYERQGAERGQHDPWTPDLVEKVVAARRAILPLDKWEERGAWRDEGLMRLLRTKRDINNG
ncbi:MAG: 3-hydroxyacyl-CoA dehydrogenase [Rhodospirillaceae bacterium]|nr:3-hydroxyacyl-CoA dehydrogenase [Rhodospirillaceae bacterium]